MTYRYSSIHKKTASNMECSVSHQETLMQNHFSKIAPIYSDVRELDSEPIISIIQKLSSRRRPKIVDVGCGDGRYSIKLAEMHSDILLSCIDRNQAMLDHLEKTCKRKNLHVKTYIGSAEKLPFEKESHDIVMTFNAIHHFDVPKFVKEVSRILENNGDLFIYTRLYNQNKQNIWGKYFPLFNEKETRLYSLEELVSFFANSSLKIDSIKFFRYRRIDSLDNLIIKAKARHYSTFSLYTDDEFAESLNEFRQNVKENFRDAKRIMWTDENVMLTLRKEIYN